MIARNRKTIALCRECHKKLHCGTVKIEFINGEPYTVRVVSTVRGRVFGNLP